MAAGDVVQSAPAASGSNPTASLPSPATAGNTLIAVGGHRSASATPSITGFTELQTIESEIANASWRRALTLWGKVAVGGEQNVQLSWTPSTSSLLLLVEIEGEYDLADLGLASDDSGTTDVSSQGTGTSAPSQPAGSLGIAGISVRHGGPGLAAVSWTNSFTELAAGSTGSGSTNLSVLSSIKLVTGTDSTVASWNVSIPGGATGGLVVIAPTGAGGTDATPTPSTIQTSTSIPAPTVDASVSVTVTPVVISTTTSIDGYEAATGVTVDPTTVATTVAIPAPGIQTASSTTATPPTVTTSISVPTPGITTTSGTTTVPTTIATSVSIPTPTILTTSSATVTPSTVALSTVIPAPTVTTTSSATVTPSTIPTTTTIPAPTVDAQVSASVTVTPSTIATTTTVPIPGVSGNPSIDWITSGLSRSYTMIGPVDPTYAPMAPADPTYSTDFPYTSTST